MPNIRINLTKLSDNLIRTKTLCKRNNLKLLVAIKCCGGDRIVLRHLVESGAASLAGAHPRHFDGLNGVEKTLLIVFPSYPDMIFRSDYAYVTELKTLEQISKSSKNHRPGIVIPLEFGDLREGVPIGEIIPFMEKALKFENHKIKGFSANFGCLRESPPKPGILEMFACCIDEIRSRTGYAPEIVSIGGSVLWKYLEDGHIPKSVNEIRIGGAIFLGADPGLPEPMAGFHRDAFVIEGRIVEIREKSPVDCEFPNLRKNGLGESNDREGFRKRAVLDFGYTACPPSGLTPAGNGIEIIGATQDLTVVDVSDSDLKLSVGDKVEFIMNYKSLAMAMICPYLDKTYVK